MNEIFHRTSPYAGCTASAPLAFVTCYRTACKMPEYAQIDMSTSVENLLLEADSLGLGAVWLGIAPLKEHMEAIHNVLQISQDLVAFSIVPCGYPDALHSQQDRLISNESTIILCDCKQDYCDVSHSPKIFYIPHFFYPDFYFFFRFTDFQLCPLFFNAVP